MAAASPSTHTECTKPVYSSVVGERSIRSKKTARNAPASDILELRKAAAPSFGRAGATASGSEPQEGSVMSVILFDRGTPAATMLRRRRAWRLADDSFRGALNAVTLGPRMPTTTTEQRSSRRWAAWCWRWTTPTGGRCSGGAVNRVTSDAPGNLNFPPGAPAGNPPEILVDGLMRWTGGASFTLGGGC